MKLAIIFDLDGTLIDTHQGIVETITAALKSIGIVFNDDTAIIATIGLPLEQGFSNLLEVACDNEDVLHCVKQYQTLYNDIVLPKAKELVFPGVAEGLEILKAHGFTLAVATINVHARAEALLKSAGLWEYFNVVVGVDQVIQPKPHPEMVRLVMKRLGVLAEHTIMVGDSVHDILMAKASGMRSIAVTYGIHDARKLQLSEPTWVVDTFDAVLNCLNAKK